MLKVINTFLVPFTAAFVFGTRLLMIPFSKKKYLPSILNAEHIFLTSRLLLSSIFFRQKFIYHLFLIQREKKTFLLQPVMTIIIDYIPLTLFFLSFSVTLYDIGIVLLPFVYVYLQQTGKILSRSAILIICIYFFTRGCP